MIEELSTSQQKKLARFVQLNQITITSALWMRESDLSNKAEHTRNNKEHKHLIEHATSYGDLAHALKRLTCPKFYREYDHRAREGKR